MENKNFYSLEVEIEKVIKEKNILWEESVVRNKSFSKVGAVLSPLAIFMLLFIIPVFNIFEIKSSGELLIGLVVSIFLFWFWYKIFRLLILNGNVMSPWVLGFAEKAKGIRNSGKVKKYKPRANFFMGVFFLFIGLMFLIASPNDSIGKGLSFGFGVIFSFLGSLGIIQYMITKKPENVLFLLRNNRTINVLIFLIISLFCLSIVFSFFMSIINR